MADYWTWLQLKTKIKDDCDLQSETFISDSELLALGNEAIDDIEKAVHSLNEDYFLSSATLTLVNGTEEYAMPSDIYAMKIRGLVYRKGTEVFPIKRLKEWFKIENYDLNKTTSQTTPKYNYLIRNMVAGSPKIVISPTPTESGAYVTIWYIRNANKLTGDSSVCDVPEAANYLVQFVKNKVYEKEHNPVIQKSMQDVKDERDKMIASLAEKTPDNDTEVEMDMGYYNDMVGG